MPRRRRTRTATPAALRPPPFPRPPPPSMTHAGTSRRDRRRRRLLVRARCSAHRPVTAVRRDLPAAVPPRTATPCPTTGTTPRRVRCPSPARMWPNWPWWVGLALEPACSSSGVVAPRAESQRRPAPQDQLLRGVSGRHRSAMTSGSGRAIPRRSGHPGRRSGDPDLYEVGIPGGPAGRCRGPGTQKDAGSRGAAAVKKK